MGGCIVYTGIRLLLLIHPFISSFFFPSNFQTLNIFVILFSGTVRPRRLKLGIHVDNGWVYHVYQNQATAAYSSHLFLHFVSGTMREEWNLVQTWTMGRCIVCNGIRLLLLVRPFISSLFFLSNFQTLKFFVTLFSGTVRPRRLKLGTHVNSGQTYRVYWKQAAALIHPFISSFFFLYNFQTLKFFVTLFSGTVRPRRLKLGTHVDSGQMHRVYQNQAAAAYLSLYSVFFLSNFQTLKIFITLFSGTVRPRRLKLGAPMDNRWMYHVYRNQAAAAICPFLHFSFSPIFKH